MVDLDRAPSRDSAVTVVNPDGHKSLNEIRFSGKKYAFAVGAQTAQAGSSDTNK
jgi:hypothetical protein